MPKSAPETTGTPRRTVDVAFAFDPGALVGLHVTLSTMARSMPDEGALRLHFFTDGVSAAAIDLLKETLSRTGKKWEVHHRVFSPERFRSMRWLGGWMTYARLLIPELLDVDRFIYCDADVIFNADVFELASQHPQNAILGAVSWETIASGNDSGFLLALGHEPDAPYFNAGVLTVDASAWRSASLTRLCTEFGERHGKKLPSADQTILNHIAAGRIAQIPRRFNTVVAANRPPIPQSEQSNRAIHLVGRPKPWDLFGEVFNGQSLQFSRHLRETAIANWRSHSALSPSTLKRTMRISKGYAKCIAVRLAPWARGL